MKLAPFSFRLNGFLVFTFLFAFALTSSFVGCKDKEKIDEEQIGQETEQVSDFPKFSTEIRSLSPSDLTALGSRNDLPTEFVYPGAYYAQVVYPDRLSSLEDQNATLDFFAQSLFQLPAPETLAQSKLAIYSKGFTFDNLKNAKTNEVLQEGFPTSAEIVYLSSDEAFNKEGILAQVFQNVDKEKIKTQKHGKYEVYVVEKPLIMQLDQSGSVVGKIDAICAGVAFPNDKSAVFISGTPESLDKYFGPEDGDSRGVVAQRLARANLNSAAVAFQYDYDFSVPNTQLVQLPVPVTAELMQVIQQNVLAFQFLFDISQEDGALVTLNVNAKSEDGAVELRKAIGTALMKGVDVIQSRLSENATQTPSSTEEIDKVVNLIKSVSLAVDGSNVVGTLKNSQDSVDFFINSIKTINDSRANAEIYAQTDMAAQILTQLSKAFALYYRKNSTYPSNICAADGTPLLSWRVALLPFLDESGQKLFDQFKLDEPWNSDDNIKLLNQMPAIYMRPSEPNDATKTQFLIFNSPETPFGKFPQGLKMQDVANPSRTFSVVYAAPEHAIEWTRPEEFAFNHEKPTDTFGPF
ncbi:MAG: DUF1559 domain-containing protein, partial [Thermoguttaceae bacterium]|nr:DUF1559 domain-containing protein [Thermoguttaceae bacterium]